ncbi:unnamed protein product [Choristocarpus tenellus]
MERRSFLAFISAFFSLSVSAFSLLTSLSFSPSHTRQRGHYALWHSPTKHVRRGCHEAMCGDIRDQFRPKRASVEPVIINTLVRVFFKGKNAATAVEDVLEERGSSEEWQLTNDERELVQHRVYGVSDNLQELRFLLATVVARNPFIAKYGMESEYGVGADLESNPLTQMNHAECLLALYILYKEGMKGTVNFIDTEKLDVLRGY